MGDARGALPPRCDSISKTGLRCQKAAGHVTGVSSPGDSPGAVPYHSDGTEVWWGWNPPPADLPRDPSNATGGPPPQTSTDELVLRDWWLDKARAEIDATVPKAVEYGSTDLIDIGLMLARTMRRTVTEEEAAELGVFFYLIGKIARWQSAIERGERPSDDTLLDIGVYVRMAQRIRDAGGWPGVNQEQR